MRYPLILFMLSILMLNACTVRKDAPVKLNIKPVKISSAKKKEHVTPAKVIDVLHTNINVTFDWEKHICIGSEDLTCTAYGEDIKAFELDAKQMKIEQAVLHINNIQTKMSYHYDTSKGVINIHNFGTLSKTDTAVIHFEYHAYPDAKQMSGSKAISGDKGLYFINTDKKEKYKPTQLWTQGETEANSHWFICVDKPHEKSTFDINITAPDSMTVLSNGKLIKTTHSNNNTTHYWQVDKPMSSYLVMMAIGKFNTTTETWRNKEVNYYLEDKYHSYAKNIFKHTPEMLEFFSNKLGVSYPWSKYSQVVVHDFVSGAMENTSATLHGSFVQKNDRELIDRQNDGIVAHELFHHWFGDLVTCDAWSHLTLNEGFATFGEQLWWQYKFGENETQKKIYGSMNSYLRFAKFKDHALINYSYRDKEDMFNPITYQKGARVLNLLKYTLGEKLFFEGTKKYLNKFAYQSVQIDDYKRTLERVSGQDLRLFFNQWYLRGGHPKIKIEKIIDSQNIKLKITQVQEGQLFSFPLEIKTIENNSINTRTIQCAKKTTTVSYPNSDQFYYFIDPNGLFIGEINTTQNQEELKQSYAQARMYIDKMRALKSLFTEEKSIQEDGSFIKKAIADPDPDIVYYVMSKTDWKDKDLYTLCKNELLTTARNANETSTRAKAIRILSKYPDQLLLDEYIGWSNEPSYAVSAAGLNGINKINQDIAIRQADKLEPDAASDLLDEIAMVYAQQANRSKEEFYEKHIPRLFNSKRARILRQYGEFAKNMKDGKSNFWNYAKPYAKNDDHTTVRFFALRAMHEYAQIEKNNALQEEIKSIIAAEKSKKVLRFLKLSKIIE